MQKKMIRLTESDIHRIVKESVKKIISEILDDPHDYAKVKGLSAAAFGAANSSDDPKWKERKMRQSELIGQRARELRKKYSDSLGNMPEADWAMSDQSVHSIKKGMKDPKDYIRRNGYDKFLSGMK